jgi:hypothetical protein
MARSIVAARRSTRRALRDGLSMRLLNLIVMHKVRAVLAALFVVAATVWLSQTWSPSSYGLVLKAFGATDTGIVLGTPRPFISDEWGHFTPMIQATVNNGFERYNKTSFYGEDLRQLVSLPLRDWGLAFKPDKWLYQVVNPAYAFSFQWLFYLVAFIAGYALLFRRLGFAAAESVALSLVLFLTMFVQFWWMLFAGAMGLFPWIILALDLRRPVVRFTAVLWISAAWMLPYFYPPLFISLAIVGAAIVYRLHVVPRGPATLVLPAIAAACACGIVVFYLWDALVATWTTEFPGHRRSGGGGVPPQMFAELLWPAAYLKGFETTIPSEVVGEGNVVGTYYTLFTAVFLDYKRAFGSALTPERRRFAIALWIVLAIFVMWQLFPIPAAWVTWTGLPLVPPRRSVFASGLALLLICALANAWYGMRFTWMRLAVFCGIVLLGWGLTKAGVGQLEAWRVWPDFAILPIAAIAVAICRRFDRRNSLVVAAASAGFGALAFGGFNPLQSAWPIFNRESTPFMKILDYQAQLAPGGVLTADNFGATLNGLGYRSVAHVLFVPALDVWRKLFPDLDATTFNEIFNRFAHIVPFDEAQPRLITFQVIGVPRRIFDDGSSRAVVTRGFGAPVDYAGISGHIDTLSAHGGRITVGGWAPWNGMRPEQRIIVLSDPDVEVVHFERIVRRDVARVLNAPDMLFSGFQLVLQSKAPTGENSARRRLCLLAQDSDTTQPILIADESGDCRRTDR